MGGEREFPEEEDICVPMANSCKDILGSMCSEEAGHLNATL